MLGHMVASTGHNTTKIGTQSMFSMINEELMSPILMWLWDLLDSFHYILLHNEIRSPAVSLYLLSARIRDILDLPLNFKP